MNRYPEIIGNTVHDLQYLAKLISEGRLPDNQILLAIISAADDLRDKAVAEAKSIRTEPVLFAR